MRLRFTTAVSDTARGYFHEGRVIETSPAASDFPFFQELIRRGICAVDRAEAETALAPEAIEHAVARRRRRTRKSHAEGL